MYFTLAYSFLPLSQIFPAGPGCTSSHPKKIVPKYAWEISNIAIVWISLMQICHVTQ